ncbi:MAG: heme lyase CcmF/NrfE family subunit, partial [Caulobacterales bacterium]|nr:heme lyase CcmF/NrfE family subunit [Caulobacterales bacterium]
GGYWGWDPVENASFMPWLVGTAFLHSAMVQEKRKMFKVWNLFLIIITFSLSLIGTFLVRSGVLTSVHAFAVDPTRGVLLLSILGVAAGSAFALFAWRSPALSPGGAFAPASRESLIVLNNILLTAATATVMLGTLFPLIREAMGGTPITVGPPYFNLVFGSLMGLAMLILPFGPLTAWKRGDLAASADRLKLAAALAVLIGFVVFGVVSPRKAFASGGVALGAWVIAGVLAEVAERTRAFRAPWPEVRRRLTGLPRGAWGMTLAHAGLGVFILGACYETAWKVETAEALSLGGSVRLGAYELTLKEVGMIDGPNYLAERGQIAVTRGGKPVCAPRPERRFYPAGRQSTSEVALCNLGISQIYVVLGERRAGEGGRPAWLVRGYFNPWVQLIFLGPLLMALGGLMSLTDRRLRFAVGKRS